MREIKTFQQIALGYLDKQIEKINIYSNLKLHTKDDFELDCEAKHKARTKSLNTHTHTHTQPK